MPQEIYFRRFDRGENLPRKKFHPRTVHLHQYQNENDGWAGAILYDKQKWAVEKL